MVSLDLPSGVTGTSGDASPGAVVAAATLTLCLPKLGLSSSPLVGDLFLADISVPPSLSRRVSGAPAPPFHLGSTLHLVP